MSRTRHITGTQGSRITRNGKVVKRKTNGTRTARRGSLNSIKPQGDWPVKALLKSVFAVVICLMLGAGLGLLARQGYQLLLGSQTFTIKEVVIKTNGNHVPEEDVIKLTGIKPGKSIFAFRLDKVLEDIRFHPWVKRVSVERKLPDKVLIDIEERSPIAIVALDSLYYIDEDLDVFKRVLPIDDQDYPVVTGIDLKQFLDDPEGTRDLLKLMLLVMDTARQSKIVPLKEVSEIHLDRVSGASIFTVNDGVQIKLGHRDIDKKWPEMERTLAELKSESTPAIRGVAVLDLNYTGRVTVKLRGGYQIAKPKDEARSL